MQQVGRMIEGPMAPAPAPALAPAWVATLVLCLGCWVLGGGCWAVGTYPLGIGAEPGEYRSGRYLLR